MTRRPGGPRQRSIARTFERAAPPVRIALGALSLAAGVTLAFTDLDIFAFTRIAGIALIALGLGFIALEAGASASASPRERRGPWRWLAPVVLVLAGAAMAIRSDIGAPALAALVGIGLMAYGILSAVQSFRTHESRRLAGLLSAGASIIIGFVSLTWPVLTLDFIRIGTAVWLAFVGLRLLFESIIRQWARRAGITWSPRLRIRHTLAAGSALALAVLLAIGSGWLLRSDDRPAPGSFYAVPANLPGKPGELLRSEPLTTGVPQGARAWKILYTSTSGDGSPTVSSGTVLAPLHPAAGDAPLLSISHGTTGVSRPCAPSLSSTPFADGAATSLTEMVVEHGWVGVTSDYAGLGTAGQEAYLIGQDEARNVLDASRAARQLSELQLSHRTVVWGHSQGGHGALWTAKIAAKYAPDLTVVGTAAMAPASDLYGLAEVDKSNAGGKVISAYIAASWDKQYPELNLRSHLTPGSAPGVDRISQLCFNDQDAIAAIFRGTQIPNQVFPDKLLAGELGTLLRENSPKGPFDSPLLVAQGLADPLVLPQLQRSWVGDQCAAGVPLDFRTYPGLGHMELVGPKSPLTPQLVQWTLDRWNGKQAPNNCASLPAG